MAKSAEAFRTISEVSEILETPAHVLRFWESQFSQVRPLKRAGGRRYYRPQDVALLGGIRKLLHDDGITIRGVQKILREQGARQVAALSGLSEDGALVVEVLAPADIPADEPLAATGTVAAESPAHESTSAPAPEEPAQSAPPPDSPPLPTPSQPEAPSAGGDTDREPLLPFLPMPAPPAPEAPMMVDAPVPPRVATVIALSATSNQDDPVAVRLRHCDIVRAGAHRADLAALYLRLKNLHARRQSPGSDGPSGAQD